ncbi:hypothetical protein J7384_17290 [Endozoicomonas sp. G2_1]|uniref:hypothetical protein n=1 Tax=Endozoicomonas sp. G2_1 TaxID=2821091 RepID=UPI001ADC221C|nr:hypothetical protein [Endozoicomonas sp. G2_1]MBO9492120.1 hypothetical protein [Endozoicomonas sp. G2_1]
MTPNANVSDRHGQINEFSHPSEKNVTQNVTPVTQNVTSQIESLAITLQTLKQQKHDITEQILDVESKLIELCGAKTEGVTKHESPKFVVATTGKLTRKITDPDRLAELAPDLIKYTPSLNMREYNALAKANPRLMTRVATCIEAKPAKTAVSLTPIE